MEKIDLTGDWKFKQEDKDTWYDAVVPSCVHVDLINAGAIPDPYYRDIENDLQWIGEAVWVYQKTFDVPEFFVELQSIRLCFQNLDTLAVIRLNGAELGRADNQFREWEFEVSDHIKAGQNELEITFESALIYGQERLKERLIPSWSTETHKLPGGNFVRKSQCNFGWDWGPKLVTCGIQEDVYLEGFSIAKLDDVHILQHHEADSVDLEVRLSADVFQDEPLSAEIAVSFHGEEAANSKITLKNGAGVGQLSIANPELWWPNGLGEQPLYVVEIKLLHDETLLDSATRQIGLRELKLVRKEDEWGESFYFSCNGVPFFAKGANWIPADTFISRVTDADYERLLQAAADAHQNMLRVWGGGIYEKDIFYELCDRMGIAIWQDFMFACATYPTFDNEFMENVRVEARQQIKRLRHHPSLALWCGNNELEQGLVGEEWTDSTMSWEDYGKLYDDMLPALVSELDPQTDYWPGSPHSPIGDRYDFNNPKWGDAHIWNVWHGMAPFEFYRTCLHRFNSEFGFQSFPEPRSLRAFTEEADYSINSPIMEHHQRSDNGNSRIIHYMLDWFRLPTRFDHQVILSQILQGMAVKYAVEHWRRTMPRGMGTLYWQLNDCWPVASWASIDYYGRWKALHYMARHFFAPLHVVGIEDWDRGAVDIYILNDHPEEGEAVVGWQLITAKDGELVREGEIPVAYKGVSSTKAADLDLLKEVDQYGRNNLILILKLAKGDMRIATNLVLFCRPKQLKLDAPDVNFTIAEDRLVLTAQKPALWVWVDVDSMHPLADNYFHLLPGEEKIIQLPPDWEDRGSRQPPAVISLWDTYQL
jgi:beta-mannosidase